MHRSLAFPPQHLQIGEKPLQSSAWLFGPYHMSYNRTNVGEATTPHPRATLYTPYVLTLPLHPSPFQEGIVQVRVLHTPL
jgi:hypothetical protein